MLAKLLKYEIKSSARTLIPLYIGTLAAAVLCTLSVTGMLGNNGANLAIFNAMYGGTGIAMVMTICYLLFFALCVATVVLTAMVIVQRFNKSLISDEGYLMFTLPVTHTELLFSKLIAAIFWVLAGSLVMFLSGVIMGGSTFLAVDADLNRLLSELADIFQYTMPYMFSSMVNGFFNIAATILLVYLSIMIAQTERFNQHRVAVAVVLFFVIGWAFGAVESTLFYGGLNTPEPYGLTAYAQETLTWYMWARAAFALVQCIICFCGTKWLMQKKLNL